MHIFLRLILACLFFLSLSATASSQVYKWRDKDGNLIVSTTPPPPGVQSERRETDQSQKSDSGSASARQTGRAVEDVEMGRANGDIKVIMYITDWCPYCKKASAYLKSLGVDLTEHDIEKDPEANREYLEKGNSEKGVPFIDIEGILLRGFSEKSISAALDKRRKTGFQY